jgi:uncharacterized repeat protein (TIGR01451 family)
METHQTEPKRAVRWLSAVLLFGAILAVMFPAGAWADGTAAGTQISNTATIEYVVGTTTLTVEDSTTFLVDRMVDLTVSRTGEAYTTGIAGDTVVLIFTVANTGNDTFDFALAAADLDSVADPYYGTDNLNLNEDELANVVIYVDSDGAGTVADYVSAEHTYDDTADTTAGSINDLNQDMMINVYMVCPVPDTAAEGAIAVMLLRATALDSNGDEMAKDSGEDVTDSVQTVFADADTDGDGAYDDAQDAQAVAIDAFQVQAPSLTVTKTSVVQEDSINGEDNPMAIPSARVRYTIVIANGGSSAASGLVVTDAIPENTCFYVGSITVTANGVTVDTPTASYSANNGTDYEHVAEAETDGNGEDPDVTNIMVDVGTVTAGTSTTVTFDVIIQ